MIIFAEVLGHGGSYQAGTIIGKHSLIIIINNAALTWIGLICIQVLIVLIQMLRVGPWTFAALCVPVIEGSE